MNTYSSAGAVVSTQNAAAGEETAITESGAVGTPIQWAVAVNGCPFQSEDRQYFSTKALVYFSGNYCVRTYQEGTGGPISCANGGGVSPLALNPPSTPGQSLAACTGQCS
jgi:hypothetical protein